jgi:zinc transporter ZupT
MNSELQSGSGLVLFAGILAIALSLVHLFARNIRSFNTIPRSRWLSFSSGVSVAYVFVHILPDLSKAQETIRQTLDETPVNQSLLFLEHHIYLMALLGISVFYGLERAVTASRQRNQESGKGDIPEIGIFWLHIGSFAIYNALIGYLLFHREEPGLLSLLFFAIALGLHFIVNDYGLRENHKHTYDKTGRWVLAIAILVGAAIGYGTHIHEAAIALLFAFIAGGIILNIFKEELPEERESHFGSFALGAGIYAVLLLTV